MTKEEMYSSYRNPDEDFERCGCCHKPLITCMCRPDDVENDEGEPTPRQGEVKDG